MEFKLIKGELSNPCGMVSFYVPVEERGLEGFQAVFGGDSRLLLSLDLKKDLPKEISKENLDERAYGKTFQTLNEEEILSFNADLFRSNINYEIKSIEDVKFIDRILINEFLHYVDNYFIKNGMPSIYKISLDESFSDIPGWSD